MYPSYRSAKYPPPGLGLSKQAGVKDWIAPHWNRLKGGAAALTNDVMGGGAQLTGYYENTDPQKDRLLKSVGGHIASKLKPFSELTERHGDNYEAMFNDPRFASAATDLASFMTEDHVKAIEGRLVSDIEPNIIRPAYDSYVKTRKAAGMPVAPYEEFKAEQLKLHFPGIANIRKIWSTANLYKGWQDKFGAEGARGRMLRIGRAAKYQNTPQDQLLGNSDAFNAVTGINPLLQDATYNQYAGAMGLPTLNSQQGKTIRTASVVGQKNLQALQAGSGYASDPTKMFAPGGQQNLQAITNVANNQDMMERLKASHPQEYQQLMAAKGQLEWANRNYGHLQSLNEFKNDPISFLFNNFFGDPTKLYSVLDSLGKIYNPKKYDQSESWNKYLASGNQAVQGYSSWWPWLSMIGNIRSSLSGDDRNWAA